MKKVIRIFLLQKAAWSGIFLGGAVLMSSAFGYFSPFNNTTEIALILMLFTVMSALMRGLAVGMMTAFGAALYFNVMILAPIYSLSVNSGSIATLLIFISVTLLCSWLAGGATERLLTIRKLSRRRDELMNLMNNCANAESAEAVMQFLKEHILRELFIEINHEIYAEPIPAANISLYAADAFALMQADLCYGMVSTEFGSLKLDDREFMTLSVLYATGTIARLHQQEIAVAALLKNNKESLRSAILSSISHDLRTPLMGIIGGVSTVRKMDKKLSKSDKDELLQTVEEEANRLNRLIENVLAMTRLTSGAVIPKRNWTEISGLIEAVSTRVKHRYPNLIVKNELPNNFAELNLEETLFGQVLQNLFENAAKYSNTDTLVVSVTAENRDDGIGVLIMDNGTGIDKADREAIFDKYRRLEQGDSQHASSGLGLAICTGIMTAHESSIRAIDRPDGNDGACFELFFPNKHTKIKH